MHGALVTVWMPLEIWDASSDGCAGDAEPEPAVLGPSAKEAAVKELMGLRAALNTWIRAHQAEHDGQMPLLEDARKASPETHDKFVRYMAVLNLVRQQP